MRKPTVVLIVAVPLLVSHLPGFVTGARGTIEQAAPVSSPLNSSDALFPLELAGDNVCNPRVQVCDS